MSSSFSDYIVYVDESGDHGLMSIDPSYPIFVLVFCVFKKQDYAQTVVPMLQSFKLRHFGHDQVILHETDIRRDRGSFAFLKSKQRYRVRHSVAAENPYHISLRFGLERMFDLLQKPDGVTHIVVEQRGKVEDDELELAFRRICAGHNAFNVALPFELVFANKKSNSTGLQLADLVARPVGLNLLKPQQGNRAFEAIKPKFYREVSGTIKDYGLKYYP
jgi:Protein of unknown function (DUF3800)